MTMVEEFQPGLITKISYLFYSMKHTWPTDQNEINQTSNITNKTPSVKQLLFLTFFDIFDKSNFQQPFHKT